jgi:hypothetical protein
MSFMDKLKSALVSDDDKQESVDAVIARLGLNKTTETEAPPAPEGLNLEESISIEEIYGKAGLGDLSKSIFKIDDLVKALPASSTMEDKKKSIPGLLAVVGLTVEGLQADASSRTQALEGTQTAFSDETTNVVETLEAKIKDLEAQIEGCKAAIQGRKKLQETQETLIDTENKRIEELKKYLI